ncbi:MAG TPA: hypothetical protein V6C65_24305 [Allocoleopsis sp.]
MTHLSSEQLSLSLDVPIYTLENPPQPGETITTRNGKAIITRIEPVGREVVFWGDYGSGIEQPHLAEALILSPEQEIPQAGKLDTNHEFLLHPVTPPLSSSVSTQPVQHPAQPKRRHSPKGKASGWIEERIGNKQRRNPSISYYYCWEIDGVRDKCYIPAGKLWRVQQMVEVEGKPIAQVLEVLNGRS